MIECLVAILAAVTPFLPCPLDKDGWGLRICGLNTRGPLIVGEDVGRYQFDLLLLNFSKEPREHDVPVVALETGTLDVSISKPGGKGPPALCRLSRPRDPFTVMHKLGANEWTSERFSLASWGYFLVYETGLYRVSATWQINGKTVSSPPVDFEVVRVLDEAVLASHTLPLEGSQLARPVEKRHRAVVEQIRVGNRIWLAYRRLGSGKPTPNALPGFAVRLVELPGKVEMTVEGAFGAGNPLTVTYQDANSAIGTNMLKIHSITGEPWTEEEERLRIEQAKPPLP
jgi:hypothetical protein